MIVKHRAVVKQWVLVDRDIEEFERVFVSLLEMGSPDGGRHGN